MTLGMTNSYGVGGFAAGGGGGQTGAGTSFYGTNVGTPSGTTQMDMNAHTLGITTDGTKSGIIADTSNFQNMLYCIKF